jgi:uncharacterized protein YggE
MTVYYRRLFLATLLTTLLYPATLAAATEDAKTQRTVSATGSASVRQKPTQMRLHMQLIAKGKTMEEALAKLKERREAATVQLEALKADKKSIVFGVPSLSNDQSSRKRQIQAMVVAQMKSRGKKVPKGLVNPQTVTLASTLTARWPLEADSQEKLLLFVQNIQEKIKAADLAGAKEAEKLTPEEEEFEEEASQMQVQYSDDGQEPGQPLFLFVAMLPKEQREKALADAFALAKTRAAELAKAAGTDLGPLVTLTGGFTGQANFDNAYARFASSGGGEFYQQMSESMSESSENKEEEAVGAAPNELKFNYNITATFQLAK